MNMGTMTNDEIKEFCVLWSKTNAAYKLGKLQFPEPLIKRIVVDKFDPSLVINQGVSTYDYVGNVELKTISENDNGTPFKHTQSNCKRIIYVQIKGTLAEIFELRSEDVKTINEKIKHHAKSNQKSKQLTIHCSKYIANAVNHVTIDLANY